MNTVPEKLEKLRKLVGNTPTLRLECEFEGRKLYILAKYEVWNFTGSIKDRMAIQILEAGYMTGQLEPGNTIVEATSGNTGISFAAMGAYLGHPVQIYMPSWLSTERKRLMRLYGAKLFEISAKEGGFDKCIALAAKKSKKNGYFGPKQFKNSWNVLAHAQTTAPELENALKINNLGELDVFIAGCGTGGTVMGVFHYFSQAAYQRTGYGNKQCKVITTIAMFYDLDDPTDFIEDVKKILDDNGVWVIQISYTPLMLKQMAFDNICHEHVYYHSLSSIKKLMEPHGFKIVDCSLNDTNGGSCRIYLQKDIAKETSFGTTPLRDVCNFRVKSLLAYEKEHMDISDPKVWFDFYEKLEKMKSQTVDFIRSETAKGKTVYGYGASTKGNTLLQYYGLTTDDIIAIAERSPQKFGKFVVGTNIPIISEKEMRAATPDYLLVLPWHFIKEFVERELDFLNNGGKFIVPCPEFEIIGKQNG